MKVITYHNKDVASGVIITEKKEKEEANELMKRKRHCFLCRKRRGGKYEKSPC